VTLAATAAASRQQPLRDRELFAFGYCVILSINVWLPAVFTRERDNHLARETKTQRPVVMISSTAWDLPEHLNEIKLGCERAGFEARMTTHPPGPDMDLKASLRMVDEADVYIGVLAYRYGYVPRGHDISITEMEYNRVVELEKPRFMFFIHEDHPITGRDLDTSEGATKLQALKDRIGKQRAVLFKSPTDLEDYIVEALTNFRKELEEQSFTSSLYRKKHFIRGTRVFISYRRSDSQHFTGRLYDRLLNEIDEHYLYMDVATIPLGKNFITEIETAVSKCDVLLAVIGSNWLTCCEENGRRRLDKSDDTVRLEISTALKRDVMIIPVFIDDTKIPSNDDLPEELDKLFLRNPLRVRHESFHLDVDRLIQALSR
jgi:hypothetical protein